MSHGFDDRLRGKLRQALKTSRAFSAYPMERRYFEKIGGITPTTYPHLLMHGLKGDRISAGTP
jgi:hypothetical protein